MAETIESIEQKYFTGFKDRRKKLSAITRYHLYPTMFYRSNDWFHSYKVYFLLHECFTELKKVYPTFDTTKAGIMALIHDDAEMIIGDFQAGNKAKLNEKELRALKDSENNAIIQLSEEYPAMIGGYSYKGLLLEATAANTIESQAMKYLDRFDALCEALHEIYAGNKVFCTHANNEYGLIELPTDFYIKRFNEHSKNYPLLTKMIARNSMPFLDTYPSLDINMIVCNGKLHSLNSINETTSYQQYNWWKQVLVKGLDTSIITELYLKKE